MASQVAQKSDPVSAAANAPIITTTTLNAWLFRMLQTGVAGEVKFAAVLLAGTVEVFVGFVVVFVVFVGLIVVFVAGLVVFQVGVTVDGFVVFGVTGFAYKTKGLFWILFSRCFRQSMLLS